MKLVKPISLFAAALVIVSLRTLIAQTPVWQPSPGHTQLPIWPGNVPDARPARGPEHMGADTKDLVAGKPWTYIENVSRPTPQ